MSPSNKPLSKHWVMALEWVFDKIDAQVARRAVWLDSRSIFFDVMAKAHANRTDELIRKVCPGVFKFAANHPEYVSPRMKQMIKMTSVQSLIGLLTDFMPERIKAVIGSRGADFRRLKDLEWEDDCMPSREHYGVYLMIATPSCLPVQEEANKLRPPFGDFIVYTGRCCNASTGMVDRPNCHMNYKHRAKEPNKLFYQFINELRFDDVAGVALVRYPKTEYYSNPSRIELIEFALTLLMGSLGGWGEECTAIRQLEEYGAVDWISRPYEGNASSQLAIPFWVNQASYATGEECIPRVPRECNFCKETKNTPKWMEDLRLGEKGKILCTACHRWLSKHPGGTRADWRAEKISRETAAARDRRARRLAKMTDEERIEHEKMLKEPPGQAAARMRAFRAERLKNETPEQTKARNAARPKDYNEAARLAKQKSRAKKRQRELEAQAEKFHKSPWLPSKDECGPSR